MKVSRASNSDHSHVFCYESVQEIVEWVDPSLYTRWKASSGSFAGRPFSEWADVVGAVSDRWKKGSETMARMVDQLKAAKLPELKSHKRRVRFNDDEGDEVDLDRLRAGQPYWRSSSRDEATGPTEVTVITDISGSGFRGPDSLFWRGAAAVALTQILEENGFNVELWVIEGTTTGHQQKIISAINLKRAQDTMPENTAVNAVSAWFYRTVDFVAVVNQAKHLGIPIDGVGGAWTPTATELDEVSRDPYRFYSAGVFTFQEAHRLMEEQLKTIIEKRFDPREGASFVPA